LKKTYRRLRAVVRRADVFLVAARLFAAMFPFTSLNMLVRK